MFTSHFLVFLLRWTNQKFWLSNSLAKIILPANFNFNYMQKENIFGGYMDCSTKKPTDKIELSMWDKQEAQIMSRIVSSGEPNIALNLLSYKTVVDAWAYLK